jgi:DNA-binding NtrC family response regulator
MHSALMRGAGLREIRRAAEETSIRIAIGHEDGNLQRAARLLGITDRALQMRRAEQRQCANGDASEASPE